MLNEWSLLFPRHAAAISRTTNTTKVNNHYQQPQGQPLPFLGSVVLLVLFFSPFYFCDSGFMTYNNITTVTGSCHIYIIYGTKFRWAKIIHPRDLSKKYLEPPPRNGLCWIEALYALDLFSKEHLWDIRHNVVRNLFGDTFFLHFIIQIYQLQLQSAVTYPASLLIPREPMIDLGGAVVLVIDGALLPVLNSSICQQ